MKRLPLAIVGLTLGALLVCAPSGEAGQKKKQSKSGEEPQVGTRTAVAPTFRVSGDLAEEQLVQELVKILNETKSPQTLLATTLALMPMGKKAQAAVPAIIRNAERLKVFETLKDISSPKAENATIIMTAVMAIQMDLALTKEMLDLPGGPFRQDGSSCVPMGAMVQRYGAPPAVAAPPCDPLIGGYGPRGPVPPPPSYGSPLNCPPVCPTPAGPPSHPQLPPPPGQVPYCP
jgi:hypothetical protein